MSAREWATEALRVEFAYRKPGRWSFPCLDAAADRCAIAAARNLAGGLDDEAREWAQAWALLDERYGRALRIAAESLRRRAPEPGRE